MDRKPRRKKDRVAVKVREIALYVDMSPASQEAITLLAALGIPMDVIFCKPGDEEVLPAAVYHAWVYEGIERIQILNEQIRFDAHSERKGSLIVADPRITGLVIRYDLMRLEQRARA